jgi:hypothetical protein
VRRRLVKRDEQAALDGFVAAYSEKWRRRTTCAPEYSASALCERGTTSSTRRRGTGHDGL